MTTTDMVDRGAADTSRPGWAPERIGELVFAGLILVLGVVAFIGAFDIRTPAGAQVGPRVFPFLVSAILVGAGIVLVIEVIRGHLGASEEGEDIDTTAATDWWTIAKIALLIIGVVVVLEPLGWWMTAALFFGGVAWSLGAPKWWRALLIGLVIGIVTQLLFGEGLGLFLPRGAPFNAWYGPGPIFG